MGQHPSALLSRAGPLGRPFPIPWFDGDFSGEVEEEFDRATSHGSAGLTLNGLKNVLGNNSRMSDRELEILFEDLDHDGDGRVSREEFIQGMRAKPSVEVFDATVSLLKSSGIIEEVGKMLLQGVQTRLENVEQGEMDVATLLKEVQTTDFKKAWRRAEKQVVLEFSQQLDALTKRNSAVNLTVREFNTKFAYGQDNCFEGIYKDMRDFRLGVEGSLGLPGKDIYDGIKLEFCHSDDSNEEFVTTNYGGTRTTPSLEYEFVVCPQVGKDYGGTPRAIIPLEVFLFAASAKKNNQDELAYDTPLEELAEEMQDMVKTALFRRVREAGLNKSFFVATKDPRLRRLRHKTQQELTQLQRDVAEAMRTLQGKATPGQRPFSDLKLTLEKECGISEDEVEALVQNMRVQLQEAKLTEEEIIALRLYTGPAFMKMNETLRAPGKPEGNNYVSVIFAAISGMVKLAEISPIPDGRVVYRGQHGMWLPESFRTGNAQGVKGGVELAFLSTTSDLQVAINYATDGSIPIVFAISVGAVDKGAALGFLSQYPEEDEILIPPRSFMEVVGDPHIIASESGPVLSIPVKINCNLQCPTLEKLRESRKSMLCAALEHMRKEIVRDVDAAMETDEVKERAKADIFWGDAGGEFVKSLKAEGEQALEVARRRSAQWYNTDLHFRRAMTQALEVQRKVMIKLRLWVEERTLYVSHLSDISAEDCDRKAAGRLRRLIEQARAASCGAEGGSEEEQRAARGKLRELVARLCQHQELTLGDVDTVLDERAEETALMKYAADGSEGAVRLLLEGGARVEEQRPDGMTALMFAAQGGHAEVVQRLVAAGADPNKPLPGSGRTAVVFAAENGHTGTVHALLRHCGADATRMLSHDCGEHRGSGAAHRAAYFGFLDTLQEVVREGSVDVNAADQKGWTALMLAAQNGHLRVVEWLVSDQKAKVNAVNEDGATALVVAVLNDQHAVATWLMQEGLADCSGARTLLAAARKGELSLVEWVVKKEGSDPDSADADGWTALMLATENEHEHVVRWLVAEGGATVNVGDSENRTALMIAARLGHGGVMEGLLGTGVADVNGVDRNGWSAATSAAHHGHTSALKQLTAAGASLDQCTDTGWTPLMAAAHKNRLEVVRWLVTEGNVSVEAANHAGWTALFAAAHGGHEEVVACLLRDGKARVDKVDSGGRSALEVAVEERSLEVAACLVVQGGADPNAGNAKTGDTALIVAARQGDLRTVSGLLGAAAAIDVDQTNLQGVTALMAGCASGNEAVVSALLGARASAVRADAQGITPLMVAAYEGKDSIVRCFAKHGHSARASPCRNLLQWEPVHCALYAGHGALAARMLESEGGGEATDPELVAFRLQCARDDVQSYIESEVAVFVGAPWHVRVDEDSCRATFCNSPRSGHVSTVRGSYRCPRGSRAYYELRLVDPGAGAQFGFATAAFEHCGRPSGCGVGDDEASWAVDGLRGSTFHGDEVGGYGGAWAAGDVIGLACDLARGEVLVSVNGDFSAPHGVFFQLTHDGEELPAELFAAFTAQTGDVEYNFGGDASVPFAFAPPAGFVAIALAASDPELEGTAGPGVAHWHPGHPALSDSVDSALDSASSGSSQAATPVRQPWPKQRSLRALKRQESRSRAGSGSNLEEVMQAESVRRWLALPPCETEAVERAGPVEGLILL